MEEQLARREAQCVIGLLDPDLRVLGTIIDDDIDDHTAAGTGTRARAVDFLRLDRAPFAARSPVAIELVKWVFRMISRVGRPIGIVHPNAISGLEVLLLQRVEKLADNVLFAPVAEPPSQAKDDYDYGDDQDKALALS